MAGNNEFVKSVLMLDGTQVSKVLSDLDTKAKKLGEDMVKAMQSGDKATYNKLSKELKSIENNMAGIKKGAFDVQKVLKNLNGTSLNDLKKAQKSIVAELSKMERGTTEYKTKAANLQKVEAALKKVKVEMYGISTTGGSMWNKAANGMNKYFLLLSSIVASLTGVVLGFKKLVSDFNDYEEKLAQLSAITGVSGDELTWLSDKAKELSTSVTDTGVKITATADDIVEGFKLMGSARPELLKDKEALSQVTEAALILSKAASIEMQPAVEAVAAAMNQFNLGASEATRIINVLGAGALEGSAEIADITESLANCGTVAEDSGLSLEQTVAAIEVLGAKQLKGAEAGTMFRSALMKMKAAGVGYTSGVFNMRDALLDINATLNSFSTELEKDAYKEKVFGERSITVGNILLDNIDTYDTLTTAVTDTNVAITQATTLSETNGAKLQQAKNKAHLMALELGEKLAPALTFSTNAFSYLLKAIVAVIEFYKEHARVINAVVVGLAAYAIAVKAETILTKAFSFAVKVAQVAMSGLNKAMKTNLWALLASAVAAAVTYLIAFKEEEESIYDTTKNIEKVTKDYNEQLAQESAAVKVLYDALKKTNPKSQERKDLIDKINSTYGTTLKNMEDETAFLAQLDTAYQNVIDKLRQKILLESQQTTLAPLIEQENILLGKLAEAKKNWDEARSTSVTTGIDTTISSGNKLKDLIAWAETQKDFQGVGISASSGIKTWLEQLKKLQEEQTAVLEGTQSLLDLSTTTTTPSTTGDGDGTGTPASDTTDLKDAYELLVAQIAEYEKQIKALIVLGKTDEAKTMNEKLLALYAEKEGYDELIKKLGEFATAEEKLKGFAALAAEDAANTKEENEAYNKKLDRQTVLINRELELEMYAEIKKLAIDEHYEKKKQEIIDKYAEKQLLKEKESIEEKLKNTQLTNDERAVLEAEFQDKEFEIKKFYAEKDITLAKDTLTVKKQLMEEYISSGETVMNAAMNIYDKSSKRQMELDEKELEKYSDIVDAKKKKLEGQLEAKLISQKTYDDKVFELDSALDKKQAKLKAEQAKREAQMALFEQTINTAIAISNAIRSATESSYSVWDLIANMASAVAAVVAEFVTVSSYQDAAEAAMPGYEFGGETKTTSGKYQYVASISDGGVKDYQVARFGEDGPEYVIPNWERQLPEVMAMESVLESIRVNKGYASGGSTSSSMVTNNYTSTISSDPELKDILLQILAENKKPTRAVVAYTDWENTDKKVKATRSRYNG